MKTFLMGVIMCVFHVVAIAQLLPKNEIADNDVIYVPTNKTIALVFKHPIKYIDRGTADILVQQVTEAESIVLVKAAVDHFKETSLSVITDNGGVYSFQVKYASSPVANTLYIKENSSLPYPAINTNTISPAVIASYAYGIIDNTKTVRGIRQKKWGISASVKGIYIKDNVLFLQLEVDNESSLDYDIDLLRLYITERVKPKRTASQEQEQKLLQVTGNIRTVKAGTTNIIVVALQKFTIPDAKYLAIQLMEKNGGRHISLKLQNRKIVKAKILPDLN